MISTRRIYEPVLKGDGYRILIDRLWPRGLKKTDAKMDLWLKEIAPSPALRKWFNHDPAKWKEFKTRYDAELQQNSAVPQFQEIYKKHPKVTLLYAAHDEMHNHALVLADFLKREIG